MLSFYRYRTNWHKIPWVSKFLCWIGRHDYELKYAEADNDAILYCFYCSHEKHSMSHYEWE